MTLLTAADKWAIIEAEDAALADAWVTLNRWCWPSWIPDPEPDNVVNYQSNGRRMQLMRMIELIVGDKAISRAWHRTTGCSDHRPDGHEGWWREGHRFMTEVERAEHARKDDQAMGSGGS